MTELLLFCLPFCMHLKAQTEQQCAVVETMSGQRIEYLLSDLPRIIHNNATVMIVTNKTNVEFQTSEIAKVYVSTTDVDAIRAIKTDYDIHCSGDIISMTGFAAHEEVLLYTIRGELLKKLTTDNQGRLVTSLNQLPTGIYIIKTQQQSIKFTKK